MKTIIMLASVGLMVVVTSGCVSVQAPERINIGPGGPPPQNVDSSRVPPTTTHEEARAELVKAYDQIRYLEHRNHRLEDKLEDAKKDKEEYKRKYKRLKDKYDD
ncbi:MAG: hypothetical protein GY778_16775 [bacterium]|nr:hypothetical protein [bacterium]